MVQAPDYRPRPTNFLIPWAYAVASWDKQNAKRALDWLARGCTKREAVRLLQEHKDKLNSDLPPPHRTIFGYPILDLLNTATFDDE